MPKIEYKIEYKIAQLEQYPLNPKDEEFAGGRFLIEASAGTGKTFTIANLVRRLVEERDIPMSRLLVTTFSNAAAAELKERIVKELNEALPEAKAAGDITRQLRLKLAIASVDDAVITTIHGFCFKMLKSFSLECGIDGDAELVSDDSQCKETLLQNYLRSNFYQDGNPLALKEANIRSVLRHTSPYPMEIRSGQKANVCNILEAVQNGLQEEKARRHLITFDDIIFLFHKALKDYPALAEKVRARFSAVFVDEFQDTSFSQCSVFDLCFPQGDRSVLFYMIGDPKQSIYRFRGADVHSYLAMKNGLPGGQLFSMPQNYRSSEYAIEAVNQIFAGDDTVSANAFLQSGIDFIRVGCGRPGFFRMFENKVPVTTGMRIRDYRPNYKGLEECIFDDVAQEIASLLSEERNVEITDKNGNIVPLRASDIAILIQTHDQAAKFIRRLARYGISASACKSGKIFQTAEASWLCALLHAWLTLSAADVRQLMLSEFFVMDCASIAVSPGGDWIGTLKKQAELWEQNGLPAAFMAFLDETFAGAENTPQQKVLCSANGERRMSNLQQLVELLHQKAVSEHFSPRELYSYLYKCCNGESAELEAEGSDDNPEQLRLERDAAAVQIVTMFASKGLEYPIVFVPFPAKTWGEHMLGKKGSPVKLHGEGGTEIFSYDAADKTEALDEALREQVRLLYVALTRAKVMTYVCTRTAEPLKGNSVNYLRSAHGVMVSAPKPDQSPDERLREMANQRRLDKPAVWFSKLFPQDSSVEPQKRYGVFERFEPGMVGSLRREISDNSVLTAADVPDIDDSWRTMSFSAYGYGTHSGGSSPADRGDSAGENADEHELVESSYFLSFPRGASMGELVHGVFEKLARKYWDGCDFSAFLPGNDTQLEIVSRRMGDMLRGCNLERNVQLPRLMDGMKRALCTPLPGLDVPLCSIGKCMAETEFFLKGDNLCLNDIISVLRQSGSDKVREFLPEAAGVQGINGILNGIIDLVFEYDGKYYIVDWKTNYLGSLFADYGAEKLRDTMMSSGYVLQYHLYAAALCLRMKQNPAFDYDAFGGVYYLFPRGMGEGENGIWYDRPPRECINELVKLFTGEEL